MKETAEIIEMAKKMTDENQTDVAEALSHLFVSLAECLYDDGYRKQSEGEWSKFEVNGKNYGQVYYQHKECPVNDTQLFPSPYHFCPNCGAKMKGSE